MSNKKKKYLEPDERMRKPLHVIAWRYGWKCGIALILIFLVMYYLQSEYEEFIWPRYHIKLTDLGIIKYLNLPVIFYAIYKGTRIFKVRHNFATISYSKSLFSGFLISLFSVSLIALFSVVFYKFIDPASLTDVLDKEYFDDTRASRAYNFLRPYRITLLVSIVYTFVISLHLKKTEHSH